MRRRSFQIGTLVTNRYREVWLLSVACHFKCRVPHVFFLWNELKPRIQDRAVGSLELHQPSNIETENYLSKILYTSPNELTLDNACPVCILHDDVIKWKHFPRYWSFVRGIHRSPVNSPHKGQWRGALMFSLICVWINGWVNNREAGDLRRHSHYDVDVMFLGCGADVMLCCSAHSRGMITTRSGNNEL